MLRYLLCAMLLALGAGDVLAQHISRPSGYPQYPKNRYFKRNVSVGDTLWAGRIISDGGNIRPVGCPPQALCIEAVAASNIDSHSVAVSRGIETGTDLRVWDGDQSSNFSNNLSDARRNIARIIGVTCPGTAGTATAGNKVCVVIGGNSRWRVPISPANANETLPYYVRYNGSTTTYYISQTPPSNGWACYMGWAGDEGVVSGQANQTDLYMKWDLADADYTTDLKLTQAASSLACNPSNLTNIYYDTDDNYAKMCKVLATGALLGATTTSTTKVGLASRAQAVAFPSSGTAFVGNDAFAYTGKSLSDSSLTGVTGADAKTAGSEVKAIGYSNIASDNDGDGVIFGFDYDDQNATWFGRNKVYSGSDFHKTISGTQYTNFRPYGLGQQFLNSYQSAYWNMTKACFEQSPDALGVYMSDTYGPVLSNAQWWRYRVATGNFSPLDFEADTWSQNTVQVVNSVTCREIAMP